MAQITRLTSLALLLQALAYRPVVQVQPLPPCQAQAHAEDQPAIRLLLEQAVAVAETAGLAVELTQGSILAIQRRQTVEDVLQLHAIGADVLHRRRTHGAGNQAEIFQTGQAPFQAPLHEWVPGLARLRLDQHRIRGIGNNSPPLAGHAQYQRLDVTGQQQVAATTDHQQRQSTLPSQGQGLAHISLVLGVGQQAGAHVDAEGVIGLQRAMLLQFQAHSRPLTSINRRSQACSIRSRTCSKPSSPP